MNHLSGEDRYLHKIALSIVSTDRSVERKICVKGLDADDPV